MWVRGSCIFTYRWGCKQVNWDMKSFWLHHLKLKRKRNIFLQHSESFIIHPVFYSLFTLVWQHFTLTEHLRWLLLKLCSIFKWQQWDWNPQPLTSQLLELCCEYLSEGAFDCMLLSCHIYILEWFSVKKHTTV